MTQALREVIAHAPFDDDTCEMLLGVYDNIHQKYRLDEATSTIVVERILGIAEAGERSPDIIEEAAAPAGEAGA